MDKEEQDKRLAELFRKIEEEKPDTRTAEEVLNREGFAIHSSLEEALEAKRKNLEAQKRRIEARKRAKGYSSGS